MMVIKNFFNLINFLQLPDRENLLIFYSEGADYWTHFEGIIKNLLIKKQKVCYLTSDKNDKGLLLKNPFFVSYSIGSGHIRNWIFENLQCNFILMTMPDLAQYQIKKSRYPVKYGYVQHSLVSLHMAYRQKAFDEFDVIFCSGPHHLKEMTLIERVNCTTPKTLIKHGYGRVDRLLELSKNYQSTEREESVQTVLIAPSWGKNCIIESIGSNLISTLLKSNKKIILRPHPQTYKFSKKKISKLVKKFGSNPLFSIDSGVASFQSLIKSDIMISDWSGAAYDFYFGLAKPVIFIDLPKKINNNNYLDIDVEPFEVDIRKKIGTVIQPNKINEIPSLMEKLQIPTNQNDHLNEHIYNAGMSDEVAANNILKILHN